MVTCAARPARTMSEDSNCGNGGTTCAAYRGSHFGRTGLAYCGNNNNFLVKCNTFFLVACLLGVLLATAHFGRTDYTMVLDITATLHMDSFFAIQLRFSY